jgi:hypothetical protein
MAKKTDEVDTVKVAEQFTEEELSELEDRFDACAHGRKLRCDECASRDWEDGRKDGFELGFNWVIREIEKRAGEAFVKGKDSSASALRDLVKEVKELAIKEKIR